MSADSLTPKVNLRDSQTITCEKCGSMYFKEVVYIKKVSKILTGSSEDTIVPFPIYMCASCEHVNDGFNPFEESPKNIINE
jgi:predicted nucleic acid-binding Zn ribbon protein